MHVQTIAGVGVQDIVILYVLLLVVQYAQVILRLYLKIRKFNKKECNK